MSTRWTRAASHIDNVSNRRSIIHWPNASHSNLVLPVSIDRSYVSVVKFVLEVRVYGSTILRSIGIQWKVQHEYHQNAPVTQHTYQRVCNKFISSALEHIPSTQIVDWCGQCECRRLQWGDSEASGDSIRELMLFFFFFVFCFLCDAIFSHWRSHIFLSRRQ